MRRQRILAVAISSSMPSLARSYDGALIFGYAAFAFIILVAIYFASGGPSYSDADLSVMALMP
jgi:hypothetical protein